MVIRRLDRASMTPFSFVWWVVLVIGLLGLCEIFPVLGYCFGKMFKAFFIALSLCFDIPDICERGFKVVWREYVDEVWRDD
jgi:hypothetical protein